MFIDETESKILYFNGEYNVTSGYGQNEVIVLTPVDLQFFFHVEIIRNLKALTMSNLVKIYQFRYFDKNRKNWSAVYKNAFNINLFYVYETH